MTIKQVPVTQMKSYDVVFLNQNGFEKDLDRKTAYGKRPS